MPDSTLGIVVHTGRQSAFENNPRADLPRNAFPVFPQSRNLKVHAFADPSDDVPYYYRCFSRSKSAWISEWVPPPPPAALPAAPVKREQQLKPVIRIYGRDTTAFVKEGRAWEVAQRVGDTYPYYAVTSKAADGGCVTAVVDTYGLFAVRPVSGCYTLGRYLPADSLLLISLERNRDSVWDPERKSYRNYPPTESYGVADGSGRLVMPLQGYRIMTAFRWAHRFYAVIAMDGRNGETNTFKLVDSAGQPVAALARYSIEQLTDRYGLEPEGGGSGFAGRFEGYFRVRVNSPGNYDGSGLVDLHGQVLFPAISFTGRYFQSAGNGFFLLSRTKVYPWPDLEAVYPGRKKRPEIPQLMLTDTAGKELFPDLPVFAAGAVPAQLYTAADRMGQAPAAPKRYLVQYSYNDKRQGMFYMRVKGRGYFGRLKGWK